MMVAFFCTFLLVLYNGLLLTSTTNGPQMSKDARRKQYLTNALAEDVGSDSSLPAPIAPQAPAVKKPTGCGAKVSAAYSRFVDFLIAHDTEAHLVIGIAYAAGCCYVLLGPQRPVT